MYEILIDEIRKNQNLSEMGHLKLKMKSYEKFIYRTLKNVEKAHEYSELAKIEQ